MKRLLETASKVIALSALAFAVPVFAEERAADVLVKEISEDVIATIKRDRDLQSGNPSKIAALVEAKILPHFDFAHTTRIAMGPNWRRATPEQQDRLTNEFRALLVRTYSTALVTYRDQRIDVKPLRARADDTQVTVRTEVRQSGAQALSIDYEVEKTPEGWKIFDIRIAGASLAATYRDTFAEAVRNQGVDGLIQMLSGKNRQSDARPVSARM